MSLFDFLQKRNTCTLLAAPEGRAALKYKNFKELIAHNDDVLDGLAALERTYYGGEAFTSGAARQACLRVGDAALNMAVALNHLGKGRYQQLEDMVRAMTRQAEALLTPRSAPVAGPPVVDLEDAATLFPAAGQEPRATPGSAAAGAALPPGDLGRLLGGKAANLARVRLGTGLPTPGGFVLTTAGTQAILRHNGLEERIAKELEGVSPLDLPGLEALCARIRAAVQAAAIPSEISAALDGHVAALTRRTGPGATLAVRSSAVGEDGAASFAGQYESVLGVAPSSLTRACLTVLASLYSPRAVLYRLRHGMEHTDTPMAVLVLAMVDAKASGVLYTVDPCAPHTRRMRIDAVAGLGDALVSGEALAQEYLADRDPPRLTARPGKPLLEDGRVRELLRMGFLLEKYFGAPQDVEWCLDAKEALVIVQSRPLAEPPSGQPAEETAPALPPGTKILAGGGVTASPGAACGQVLVVSGGVPGAIPDGAILAAPHAAPELAALMDRAGGIVTAMGGIASHLASVAREMGVPALFGVPGVPGSLAPGSAITLDATGRRVLAGCVEAVLTAPRTPPLAVDSPMHKRLRAALDILAPLTLTDPKSPDFTADNCRTIHDAVRFAHETAMREMFGLSGHAEDGGAPAARLKAAIPLMLYCVDIGGGLSENLTSCDAITPGDLRSTPMQAIWQGFTHPGITWSGTVAFNPRNFMTMLASTATAELGGGEPGGDSYAMLGRDYVNLSARFGYHFANLDAYCGQEASRNHVVLRFAGGAGGFTGKRLRIAFLSRVLASLGFTVWASGDVLDASLKGADATRTKEALDQTGRLLACSRLLDMAITSQADVEAMAQAFARGDYDLLSKRRESPLPGFHLAEGEWSRLEEDGQTVARQDGSQWVTALSRSFAGLMGKVSGRRYQRLLDSMEAYFHFPLAVAKDSAMGLGRASLAVRPVAGSIDQAAGLAFAVTGTGSYLVFRINALEDNAILFEFTQGKRRELVRASLPVACGQWRELAVDVAQTQAGAAVTCFVDGKAVIVRPFEALPRGLLGLWSKADSVADYARLSAVLPNGEKRDYAM